MEKAFEMEMKELIQAEKVMILKKFSSASEDFRNIMKNSDARDSGDIASDDVAVKKMEAINRHDTIRLKQIESALQRIGNGNYGICLSCGKRIPQDRLRAIPYALFCIECKNAKESPRQRVRA